MAAIGVALAAYGQYSSGKAQAESRRNQAELGFMKADEILRRNEINTGLLQTDSKKFIGSQIVQIAGSGRRADASTHALLEETAQITADKAIRDLEVAQWDADMAIAAGKAGLASAADIQKAGTISALGTGVSGIARAYYASPKGDS